MTTHCVATLDEEGHGSASCVHACMHTGCEGGGAWTCLLHCCVAAARVVPNGSLCVVCGVLHTVHSKSVVVSCYCSTVEWSCRILQVRRDTKPSESCHGRPVRSYLCMYGALHGRFGTQHRIRPAFPRRLPAQLHSLPQRLRSRFSMAPSSDSRCKRGEPRAGWGHASLSLHYTREVGG